VSSRAGTGVVEPPTDLELVERARAGDRSAMELLLRRHQPRLYAVCRRIVGNDADAADATQEALIAIVRGLARFDGHASFGTWAYRIATNASLDELRRRRRRPHLSREHDLGDDLPPLHARSGPVEQEEVAHLADRFVLDAALAGLPDEFRAVVVLRDVADLDYAEIAAVLDIPPGTVRSRIARGRAALAAALGNRADLDGRPTTVDPEDPPTAGPPNMTTP
jgi:RNA polymerase sigma-70 factor, ECF subfamily